MFFSIIIPVYNVGEWLVPCLESVKSQTDHDWECWLIDDGSTDGSEKVCDKYAASDERFTVIHQVNQGVSAARNTGLSVAKGEWIWCVDGDDVMHPQALECLQIACTSSLCPDVVYFDYESGRTIAFHDIELSDAGKRLALAEQYPEMSAWRCVFRRTFCSSVHFPSYRVGEDLLFCINLFLGVRRVCYLPLVLYGYINRTSSVINNLDARCVKDLILWMSEALQIYNQKATEHFSHLYHRRWSQFLLYIPSQIVECVKRKEGEGLIELWINKLEALNKSRLNFWRRGYCEIIVLCYKVCPWVGKKVVLSMGKLFGIFCHAKRSYA